MKLLDARWTLWPLIGLLAAAPSFAGVPDPTNCTVPNLLLMVGRDGGGAADPAHPFTVVIRDFNNQPRENNSVVLDFHNCTDLRICTDQADPNVVVDCVSRTIRGLSAVDGHVTFRVLGGAANSGASPGPTNPAMTVYADGVFLNNVRVAAFDQSGSNGMDGGDHSVWLADFMSGQAFARSDYDGDGVLGGNDLSLWLAAFFGGASAVGCGSATCP